MRDLRSATDRELWDACLGARGTSHEEKRCDQRSALFLRGRSFLHLSGEAVRALLRFRQLLHETLIPGIPMPALCLESRQAVAHGQVVEHEPRAANDTKNHGNRRRHTAERDSMPG